MVQCSVYIAVSLDGYIAREDGDINWLHNPLYTTDDAGDFGYSAFIAGIDTLVMGRNTFEKVLSFGEWPYGTLPVVVLSTRHISLPHHLTDRVRVLDCVPESLVAKLQSEGIQHIYVDGGQTIQRFVKASLINDITLTFIPILLGKGIPLFGSLEIEVPLLLKNSQAFSNGFVQSTYEVIANPEIL
ncbi:MAG: dihydrofolate reductase [Anaerolineales bacterium]|nr:MAG: dihydrofolate reductase [Anaerolineales bacterium]